MLLDSGRYLIHRQINGGKKMKQKLSELMDGALEEHLSAGVLQALKSDAALKDDWDTWHLIGDCVRGQRVDVSLDFTQKVMSQLASEPTVLAPANVKRHAFELSRRYIMPIAASVAGIGVVAWLALSPDAHVGEHQMMNASSGVPVSSGVQVVSTVPSLGARSSALPAANDGQAGGAAVVSVGVGGPGNEYLVAHQAYSPMAEILKKKCKIKS